MWRYVRRLPFNTALDGLTYLTLFVGPLFFTCLPTEIIDESRLPEFVSLYNSRSGFV